MLLKAAINGARTPVECPALPVTPAQQAAAEAVAAGAGAIHVHVRSADGRESLAAADLSLALVAIRAAIPEVPVGVSTAAWIEPDPAARLRAVAAWSVLPDFASVNFDEDGAGELAELLLTRGVGVEAGLGDARAAEWFVAHSRARSCLRVLLEPHEQDVPAALGTVAQMEALLDRAGITLLRLLHGAGASVWPLIDEAAVRGYDTRVGFEDTLTLPDGSLAPSNGALVAEARRRVNCLVRPLLYLKRVLMGSQWFDARRSLSGLMAALVAVAATSSVTAGDQEFSPVVAWGELKVFARSANGKLVHRSYDGEKKVWSRWETLGDKEIASAPSTVMSRDDRLHVFFRGTDGKMYCYYKDKGQDWSGIRDHWGGRELSSAPSAVVVGDVLTVFARSKDGKLMRTCWDGAKESWTDWEDID
jgi:uncharacterized protein (DUF849 family)